jgi:hypothetical protein
VSAPPEATGFGLTFTARARFEKLVTTVESLADESWPESSWMLACENRSVPFGMPDWTNA